MIERTEFLERLQKKLEEIMINNPDTLVGLGFNTGAQTLMNYAISISIQMEIGEAERELIL